MTPEEQAAADQQKRDADAVQAKAVADQAAADKAAADKAAADKAAADAAAAAKVPDKYELKLSDGSPLDPKVDVDQIAAFAKAQGWTNEQAQKHLEHVHAIASGLTARQQEQQQKVFTDLVTGWKAETLADKDLGGANQPKTEANVKRAMDRFAPEGSPFRKLVDDTGYGNHKEFVRFVNAIGAAMAEDKPLNQSGGPGQDEPPPDHEVFFGKKNK